MTNPLGWFLLVAMYVFAIQPVSVLGHELGHAWAATALGSHEAAVTVGKGPWSTLRLGRITVYFSPVPTSGVHHAGLCRYDPRGLSWRDRGWIALSGPIATAAQLALVAGTAALLWHEGSLVRYLACLSLLGLISNLADDLPPRHTATTNQRATVAQRDGWQARVAFALHQAGEVPPPAHPVSADPTTQPVFEPEWGRATQPRDRAESPRDQRHKAQPRMAPTPPQEALLELAAADQNRDRQRNNTSVPPPGQPVDDRGRVI